MKNIPSFHSVRAILFDIDDTLFPSSEFSSLARQNAIHAMIDAGLDASPKEAYLQLEKIVKSQGSNSRKHFDALAKHFGCKSFDRAIAAGIAAYHNTKSSISPYPKISQTLLALRSKNFVVCAASEGVAIKQWDKLIRLGLDQLFHHVFVTNSSRSGKDAAFYQRIIRALKLKPHEILMVGDNPAKDIAPAKSAGLKTVQILSGKHAKEKSNADLTLNSVSELAKIIKY